jgi:hypothetical protein
MYGLDTEFHEVYNAFVEMVNRVSRFVEDYTPVPTDGDGHLSPDDISDDSDDSSVTAEEQAAFHKYFRLIKDIVNEVNINVIEAQALILQGLTPHADNHNTYTPKLVKYVGTPDEEGLLNAGIQGGLLNLYHSPSYALRVEEIQIYNKECVLLTLLDTQLVELTVNWDLIGDFRKEHQRLRNHIILGRDNTGGTSGAVVEKINQLSTQVQSLQTIAHGGQFDCTSGSNFIINNPSHEEKLYKYLTDSMDFLSTLPPNINQNTRNLLDEKLWSLGNGFVESPDYEDYYNKTNPNTKCLLKLQARRLRKAIHEGIIDPFGEWVKDMIPLTTQNSASIRNIHDKFDSAYTASFDSWHGDANGDARITAGIDAFETWVGDTQELNLATKNALATSLYFTCQDLLLHVSEMTEKKPSGTILNKLNQCLVHMRNVINKNNPEMLWLLKKVSIRIGYETAIDPL